VYQICEEVIHLEALDVVLNVLHKNVTDKIVSKRRGPKGYGNNLKLRLLLYAILVEMFSTRMLIKHLNKRQKILFKLGFTRVPNKRTIDRWKKKLDRELEQTITLVGDHYLQLNNSEWTILDSTPLRDEKDPEATVGYNSQGRFKGFKLHMSCDEKEVPLRAVVTQAHVHDSKKALDLLAPTPRTGGDSAYDAEEIKQAVKKNKSKPVFVHNPRRLGKEQKKKSPRILKAIRYVVEQGNSYVKNGVMKNAWTHFKGLKAKAVFALTAVLAIQALAIFNLKSWGYPSIRIQEVRI